MKAGILYSGGKDSNFALFLAQKYYDVSCLITLFSNKDNSYMFQSAGVDFTKVQSQCLNIEQILVNTCGKKEEELEDLKIAILEAKKKFGIKVLLTGAINSVYQASRIQKICLDLNIKCVNPLWQKNQEDFLYDLIKNNFKVLIVGIFSYPLDESFLGKEIDKEMILKLIDFKKKYKINPAGEGGEIETLVLDSPIFKKKIDIVLAEKKLESKNCGFLDIKKFKILDK